MADANIIESERDTGLLDVAEVAPAPPTRRKVGAFAVEAAAAATVAKLEQAERLLEEAQTMAEADQITQMGAAVEDLSRRFKLSTAIANRAVGIRVKAETRLGMLVKDAQIRGWIAGHGGNRGNGWTGGKQAAELLGSGTWKPDQRRAWNAKLLAAFGLRDAEVDAMVAQANAADQLTFYALDPAEVERHLGPAGTSPLQAEEVSALAGRLDELMTRTDAAGQRHRQPSRASRTDPAPGDLPSDRATASVVARDG